MPRLPKNLIENSIALINGGLKSNFEAKNFIEIHNESSKKDKVYFKIQNEKSQKFHITYQKSTLNLYEKSKLFYEKYKNISIRPIYFDSIANWSFFVQEYFDGRPIDKLYDEGLISEDDVNTIIKEIHCEFDSKLESSDFSNFLNEFNYFKENFLKISYLSNSDRYFFEKNIFDELLNSIECESDFSCRVSNGDLVARNILVSQNLEVRVIDCEYSTLTHFHKDDFARLSWFTNDSFRNLNCVKTEFDNLTAFDLCISYLRQIYLNSFNHTHQIFRDSFPYEFSKCLHLVDKISKSKSIVSFSFAEIIQNRNQNSNQELIKEQQNLIGTLQSSLKATHSEFLKNQNSIVQCRKTSWLNMFSSYLKRISKQSKVFFDAETYLNLNPDLKLHFGNNFKSAEKHFWNIGRFENRRSNISDFDPRAYLALNHDLQAKFGDNLQLATEHYINCGQFEKRIINFKELKGNRSYAQWIEQYDLPNKIKDFKTFEESSSFFRNPLISILIPVYKPNLQLLDECIQSVCNQIYGNWELIIVDDGSQCKDLQAFLHALSKENARVKIKHNHSNSHISSTLNDALSLSRGSYICFLDQDDLLSPYALFEIVKALNKSPFLRWIYTDEDKITFKGTRRSPHFKPDWNYDLLTSINYICHLVAIERNILNQLGGFRTGYEGSQDWDLFLRLSQVVKESEILHIPKVLYHWRIHDGSTATRGVVKSYAIQSAKKALQDHFDSKAINVKISIESEDDNRWHVRFPNEHSPKVSILVPTKDRLDLLKPCIQSVLEKTRYDNYEIVIIDNNSEEEETQRYLDSISSDKIRILKDSKPFNHSRIMNNAVKLTDSDLICLFNNDVEVISDEWLGEMVSDALRSEVGCVGAKLLYPNNDIQHAGVIVGLRGVAGHVKSCPKNFLRYDCKQNYSAVTGACLLIKKQVFLSVGGLDERHLPTHFNDIDLCLKVRGKEYKIVYNPKSLLYHHESASRGQPAEKKNMKEFNRAVSFMRKKWQGVIENDIYYSPNFSYNFEGFKLAFPPITDEGKEV